MSDAADDEPRRDDDSVECYIYMRVRVCVCVYAKKRGCEGRVYKTSVCFVSFDLQREIRGERGIVGE